MKRALVATAVAVVLVALNISGAAAHSDEGLMAIETRAVGDPARVEVRVRITYLNDGEPASGATVTVEGAGPSGAVLAPQPLSAEGAGIYAAVVDLPSSGAWKLRASSTTPNASAETDYDVAEPVAVRRALRSAATAWANAFLTGTPKEIARLQGSACRPEVGVSAGSLRRSRAAMRRQFGRPLDAIAIRGVRLRNVTGTSGEAEVLYDLRRSVAGNDNWVAYEVDNGRWKVADCHAPIGGMSRNASSP
jgi:hypothetical protein